jgi:anthranilate synthase component 1
MNKYFDIDLGDETPASVFVKLRSLSPSFLLESIERGVDQSRYSFLGLGVSHLIKQSDEGFAGSALFVNGEEVTPTLSGIEMTGALRYVLDDLPDLKPSIPGIPFDGGMIGFTSYDTISYYEDIGDYRERSYDDQAINPPHVAYVAPASLLVFDHVENAMALLHSGSEQERSKLKSKVIDLISTEIKPRPNQKSLYTLPLANIDKKTFCDAVDKAKQHIFEGDIFQIVLSIAFSGGYNLDSFDVYRAMRLVNPSPYMFYCDIDGFQVVGSSPEALVKLNNKKASLRPIAGTRPRGKDSNEDLINQKSLLADEKELAEHVMLVDLARNDLGRVAKPGSITVEPYQSIEYYSHVMHIVSGVQGILDDDKDAFDLFAASFPAGTLVGAPKVRAMQIIFEIEPSLRGIYGGTVGYFAKNGNMDQAIAIRTIVFSGGQYCFQAGAGIVADSQPETEFEEVMAKSEILRTALKMAQEGSI